jgi:hypothetical protein
MPTYCPRWPLQPNRRELDGSGKRPPCAAFDPDPHRRLLVALDVRR